MDIPHLGSGTLLRDAPIREYVTFTPPRLLVEYVEDGQVVVGHEANRCALHWEAIEAMNLARQTGKPCEYVVIGEERYGDGRFYHDLGMNPDWVRANTDYQRESGERSAGLWVWVCPDCGAKDGSHVRVTMAGKMGGLVTVACPRAPKKTRSFER